MAKWVLVIMHPESWHAEKSIAQIPFSNKMAILNVYRVEGEGLEVSCEDIPRGRLYARRGVDDPIVRLASQLIKGNGNADELYKARLKLTELLEKSYTPKSLTDKLKGMLKRVMV